MKSKVHRSMAAVDAGVGATVKDRQFSQGMSRRARCARRQLAEVLKF